ncbi:PREDICTED: uncharacterized protein LOC101382317 [Odobenus rosmarus divergens]|uniref:Uncharacterized protein LOC101382317 n=1 Tax=Odobenus rosmarus divergens TaxID=9708 RepID=A0A9B0LNQ5_ODORO
MVRGILSGRSGREGVKAVSVCDGSGRDRVSVQEGPSGGRDASGSGPRRRGRRPCRRLRNQAGQFISVVTLFEVMARRRSSILAQGAALGGQDVSGPGTRRRGRPPRKHRKRKVAISTEVTLFEMVALGKNSVQTAVEEWVQSYKVDRELALLDLISFFVQCCGCEGMVTAELYQSNQGQNVVHKMTEKFDQGGCRPAPSTLCCMGLSCRDALQPATGDLTSTSRLSLQETGLYYKKFLAYPWILTIMWPEKLVQVWEIGGQPVSEWTCDPPPQVQQNDFYPIVGPGPFWKRFRVNFCEFTELLVHQTHSSVLCDGHLMHTVICMLSGLTNSAVYSLRHTSSLAGDTLHTAVPGLLLTLSEYLAERSLLWEVEPSTGVTALGSQPQGHGPLCWQP